MEECIPPVEPASTGYVLYAGLLGIDLNYSCNIIRIAVFDQNRREHCNILKL